MDSNAKSQLNGIVSDLRQIASRLDSVAASLSGIKGVGAELCAERLRESARKYRSAANTLNTLD